MRIPRGRPRLTPERYQERLSAYCARYGIPPLDAGLPPFPAGQRETPQHREWMSLYKAHSRIARRDAGASAEDRLGLLKAQDGRCPICGEAVDATDPVDTSPGTGSARALLHRRCHELVGTAKALGPMGLDRLRAYLWPASTPKSSR